MKRKKPRAKFLKAGELPLTYFTALEWMRFEKGMEVRRSEKMDEGELVTSRKDIQDLISDDVKTVIGTLEAGGLLSCPIVMIHEGKLAAENLGHPSNLESFLALWMKWEVGVLLLGFWVVKENSITAGSGFMIAEKNRRLVSSNSWPEGIQMVNSQGEQTETEWNEEEVIQANEFAGTLKDLLRDNFFPFCFDFSEAPEAAEDSGIPEWLIKKDGDLPRTAAIKGTSRVERFFYLLWTTIRDEHDLGFRITYLIQALETLFASDKGELTYRLSLRVALLSSDVQEQQIKTYELLKVCYGVRSAMIHGGAFDPKQYSPGKPKDIAELSRRLEDLVRQIARRLLEDSGFRALFSAETHVVKGEERKKSLEEIFTRSVFTRELPEIEGKSE